MKLRAVLVISLPLLLADHVCASGAVPGQLAVRVVDEEGKEVEDAKVRARYLATVRQEGKDFHVPIELAPPQTTDRNGRCNLDLQDVSWTLAGLSAHRVQLSTEEVVELTEHAPLNLQAREAFDRKLDDLSRRFSTAYLVLTPESNLNDLVTLKLAKSIRLSGRVRVNGNPLANAFVSIYSPQSQVDRLFPRSAPSLTDSQGKFSFYAVAGDFDRARIVVERSIGNYVLDLRDVRFERTPRGLSFEFETAAKDYILMPEPKPQ